MADNAHAPQTKPESPQTAGRSPAADGAASGAPSLALAGRGSATALLRLQRVAGNAAARTLVQRDPPSSSSDAGSPPTDNRFRSSRVGTNIPSVIGAIPEVVAALGTITLDEVSRRNRVPETVLQPTSVYLYTENYIVILRPDGTPFVVAEQDTMNPTMINGPFVVLREQATGHVWFVGNRGGRSAIQSYTNIGGLPNEEATPGVSVLLLFMPGVVMSQELARSLRRRARGRRGTGAEAPPWAHEAVRRARRRQRGGAGDEGEGPGAGERGEGRGGGGTDEMTTGQGEGEGQGEGTGQGEDREGEDRESQTSAQQPLRGRPRLRVGVDRRGRPEVRITLDRARTSIRLRQGESDRSLDRRIDQAIQALQESRDPTRARGVRGGASETGFVEPSQDSRGVPEGQRGEAGQAVEGAEAREQAESTPGAATPGERIPGAQGGANAPAYPARMTMGGQTLEQVTTTLGATNSFGMILDYAAQSMGMSDEVFNRLQPINFYWELLDMTGLTREQTEAQDVGSGEAADPGSGEGANIRRTLRNVAEDQESDIQMMSEEDWPWEARAAYLGVIGLSNSVRLIGSLIESYISLVTRPRNERSMGFDREGELLLRCVATPQVSDEARADPATHVIRASSVAVMPIRVMNLSARAQRELESEDRRFAELEAQVREARTEEDRRAARVALEAYRRGQREGGLEHYRSTLRNVRTALTTARSLKDKVDRHVDESEWTTQELWLQVSLLQRRVGIDEHIQTLQRQLRAVGGTGAERGEGRGEHERWVASQAGTLTGNHRPRLVLASEENGQVTPVMCMLGQRDNSTDDHPRWRLVDISSASARDVYDGESDTNGAEGHRAAIRDTFRNFAENNQYGRGTLAIRLPDELVSAYGAIDRQMRSHPGARARALQRLQDLATAAEVAALFATGGVGLAIGIAGGVAGAIVAADSLARRARTDHVMEVGTIFDILGVVGGAVGGLGAATRVARGTAEAARRAGHVPSWVSHVERTERALHIYGTIDNVQQVVSIPVQLAEELQQIDEGEGEPGDKAARRALALMRGIRSGVVTFTQIAEGGHEEQPSLSRPLEGQPLPEGHRAPDAHAHADDSGPALPPETSQGGPGQPHGQHEPGTPSDGDANRPSAGDGTGSDEGSSAGAPELPAASEVAAEARRREEAARRQLADERQRVEEARRLAERRRREAEDAAAAERREASGQPTDETAGDRAPEATAPAADESGTPSGAAIDRMGAILQRIGPEPGDAAAQVRTEATTSPAAADPDAVRLLHETRDFGAVRRQVDSMSTLTERQSLALKARIQEARLAVTNEQVARVIADMHARFPDLAFHIQDLGSPGFGSDRDITIRVEPKDPAAYARLPDAERAAMDRQRIQASAETVPELYAALERAGYPADRSLDSNFYTELHEGSVRPADQAEATRIAADQQIVSLTEIIIHAGREAFTRYVERQRSQIESLREGGTPDADVDALRQRLDQQVAAAEARVRRLLGELPEGHGGGGAREAALDAARSRLVEALQRDPAPSARELRQLMADVKLLEPDAYGTRAAVEGVVLGGQAMTRATLRQLQEEGFRTRRQIQRGEGEPGPRRFNEDTGRMEEVPAEEELARRRAEAHRHVGRTRPGEATSYESDARNLQVAESVLGHFLGHLPTVGDVAPSQCSTAAKNLGRIVSAAQDSGGGPSGNDPALRHLSSIVNAKQAGNPEQAMASALQWWGGEASVQAWAQAGGHRMSTDVDLRQAFIAWSRQQALDLVSQLRVRTETGALYGDVPVGSPDVPAAPSSSSTGSSGGADPAEAAGGGDGPSGGLDAEMDAAFERATSGTMVQGPAGSETASSLVNMEVVSRLNDEVRELVSGIGSTEAPAPGPGFERSEAEVAAARRILALPDAPPGALSQAIAVVIERAVADFRARWPHTRPAGTDSGLTADALRGACGAGRDVTADSIASLTVGSTLPVVVHRMQAAHLDIGAQHAFTVIALSNGSRYLVDPTFAQFADQIGGRTFSAERMLSDPEGAETARDLLREGFIPLTEEAARNYVVGLGAPAATVDTVAARLLAGDASVLSETIVNGEVRRESRRPGEAYNTVLPLRDPDDPGGSSIIALEGILGRMSPEDPARPVLASLRERLLMLEAVQPPLVDPAR